METLDFLTLRRMKPTRHILKSGIQGPISKEVPCCPMTMEPSGNKAGMLQWKEPRHFGKVIDFQGWVRANKRWAWDFL